MLASKVPVVSDLFVSLVVKEPVYNISIPVLRDGSVRYVMSLGLLPKDLAGTLKAVNLNPSWTTTIWDRNNVVLARSRDHDRFLGTKLPNTLRDRQVAPQAILKTTNLDGEQVLLAVTTSKLSGWGISVGVPAAVAEAPLRSSLWLWGGTTLLVVAAASLLGLFMGKLLEASLVNLAVAARAATPDNKLPTPSSVREINEVARTLYETRESQIVLLREISHRVKNLLAVVQALITRSLSDEHTMAEAREIVVERLHALSRAHDALVAGDWSGVALAHIVVGELSPFVDRAVSTGRRLSSNPILYSP